MYLELQGLLFAKEGISLIGMSICKYCHNCLLNNKMPKLALVNGLWIGITPNSLPKLMIVEKALITRYCCQTILIKLRYSNKGGKTCFKRKCIQFFTRSWKCCKTFRHIASVIGIIV